MVKPSTEAVQPLGSTFSEQEFHGQWEEVLTGARGRRLEAAAMARGVVSLSISSELRAGLDAEVWLWSGGSWGRGDEELCGYRGTERRGSCWDPSGASSVGQQYDGAADRKCR